MTQALRTLAAVAILLPWLVPLAPAQEAAPGDTMARIEDRLARLEQDNRLGQGEAVYNAACAPCHGVQGDGDGPGADGFGFPATDFRRGVYKLRSTEYEALPTEADLRRTIRRGMSGTEMVPFRDLLTERSIRAVAAYLKTFSERFGDPDEPPPGEAMVELPAERPFERTPETVAAGREVYLDQECDTCHGTDGGGQGPDAEGLTDDWDRPIRMFDWAHGEFKSGSTDLDLFRVITTGMNGTPMENYGEFTSAEERWQLVDYIRSFEEEDGLFHWLFAERPSGRFGY